MYRLYLYSAHCTVLCVVLLVFIHNSQKRTAHPMKYSPAPILPQFVTSKPMEIAGLSHPLFWLAIPVGWMGMGMDCFPLPSVSLPPLHSPFCGHSMRSNCGGSAWCIWPIRWPNSFNKSQWNRGKWPLGKKSTAERRNWHSGGVKRGWSSLE